MDEKKMKNAINNIFDKGNTNPQPDLAAMRILIDQLDDARDAIDPNGQISDLIHRISRELRDGLDWVADPHSLAMAVVLIGISLNEILEKALDEESGIEEGELDGVYPTLIEMWLNGISQQLGVEVEK